MNPLYSIEDRSDVIQVGCKDFYFIEKPAPSLHVRAMHSCYSMNNATQQVKYFKDITYKNIIPFVHSWPLSFSSCQISCLYFDRNFLNNVSFITPSLYKIVKRSKNLKNPQKNKNGTIGLAISCFPLNT